MFILVYSLLGCQPPEPAEFVYGFDMSTLEINLLSPHMGVHPSTVVLDDPNNPFTGRPLLEDKWTIEDTGYPAVRFYGWATQLAVEPIGENQFYTAKALDDCYRLNCVPSDQLYYVWQLAIDAYQAQLDHFPGSVGYLADGVTSFPFAPLAYSAIEALGGTVDGWIMVEDEEGNIAVLPMGGE